MFKIGLGLKGNRRRSGSGIPAVPFPNLEPYLIFKDYLGFGRVFKDVAGTIPVEALGEPVALVLDYSTVSESLVWDDSETVLWWDDSSTELVLDSLTHSVQSTSSKRPLFGLDPDGKFYLKHDQLDDYLTIPSLLSGVYTFATASWCGVQIYQITHKTTGEFRFNPADTTSRVLVSGTLTSPQRVALAAWLESRRFASGATDVFRIFTGVNSVSLSVTESGSSGSSWELGGEIITGISCVKSVFAPQPIIYRATHPENITVISWTSKSLFGQIDLTKLINLTTLYLSSNFFSGQLDISLNVDLQILYAANNKFGGDISFSANTLLQTLQVGNNLLTGNINLSNNTLLTTCGLSTNQFSTFSGTVSSSIEDFQVQNNILTQTAVDAILAAFVAANRTTGIRNLNLGGTGNASPSLSGLANKAILNSRGWTVTHN